MLYLMQNQRYSHPVEFANALYSKGDALLQAEKYNESADFYYRGKLFAERYLDVCNICGLTYRMGLVAYKQEKGRLAARYFLEALKEKNSCKSRIDMAEAFSFNQAALNAAALAFQSVGMLDSAEKYYREGILFIKGQKQSGFNDTVTIQRSIGVIYGNLGGLLALKGNHRDAINFLKKSIYLNDRTGYELADAQTARFKLSELYLALDEPKMAHKQLDSVRQFLNSSTQQDGTVKTIRLNYFKLRWLYFDKIGLTRQAYIALKKYDSYRNSISGENKTIKNIDLESSLNLKAQKAALALNEKENELKTSYLVLTVTILFLLSVILTLVWRNLQRYRSNARSLKLFNEKIELQNQFLQSALDKLELSQAENFRMMSVVAHDLRNPISEIYMSVDMLLKKASPATKPHALHLMKQSAERCLKLISEILNGRIASDHNEGEEGELFDLLHQVVEFAQVTAAKKNQQITLEATRFPAPFNTHKLWRLFNNLISNATKFSPEGSEIVLTASRKTQSVLVAIKDHGIGMPLKNYREVFDLHEKLVRPGTNGEQSYGIGLSICQQIVKDLKGSIRFEPTPGGGTTFFVELPIDQ